MTVKLFASLRHGRFNEQQLAYVYGIAISSILEDLNIDSNEVGILLVNGCHVKSDYKLQEGDTLSIFPLIGGG
jgi:molybdopterin synthase sulfur carrier subunit